MSFERNLSKTYRKYILDTLTVAGLNALKTAAKKIAHKAPKATGEFRGNKIPNTIIKPEPVPEEIIIPLEQRENILNKLRQGKYYKVKHFKISSLLNDSAVSKFVTKNGSM